MSYLLMITLISVVLILVVGGCVYNYIRCNAIANATGFESEELIYAIEETECLDDEQKFKLIEKIIKDYVKEEKETT